MHFINTYKLLYKIWSLSKNSLMSKKSLLFVIYSIVSANASIKKNGIVRKLITASKKDDVTTLEKLLGEDPNPHAISAALKIAATNGTLETVQMLLKKEPRLSSIIESLTCAVTNGHSTLVKLFLSTYDTLSEETLGQMLLCLSQKHSFIQNDFKNYIEITQLLLDHAIDYDLVCEALKHAAEKGHHAIVQCILNSNLNIPKRDALLLAMKCDYPEIILTLIHNDTKLTLLSFIYFNNINQAQFLLRTTHVDQDTLWHALCYASTIGYTEFVELFLTRIRLTEAIDDALYIAAQHNHTTVTKLLLTHNPSKKGIQSTFISAALNDQTEIIKVIVTTIKSLDIIFLQAIYAENHKEIQKMLDAILTDDSIEAALEIASYKGYTKIVEMILSEHTDVRIGKIGIALSHAAKYGHTEIVCMLLHSDLYEEDITEALSRLNDNKKMHYLLKDAAHNGDVDVIEIILKYNHIPTDETVDAMMIEATHSGQSKILKQLLNAKENSIHVNSSFILDTLQKYNVLPTEQGISIAFDSAVDHYKNATYPIERMRFKEIMELFINSMDPDADAYTPITHKYDSIFTGVSF